MQPVTFMIYAHDGDNYDFLTLLPSKKLLLLCKNTQVAGQSRSFS